MILFVAEHKNGKLRKSALELVSAAKSLAESLDAQVAGLVLGDDIDAVTSELARYVDTVYAAADETLSEFRAEPYTTVVANVAKEQEAKAVLVAASRSGLSYSPRVALRLGAALLEDINSLEVQDGRVTAQRFSYLSRVTETVQAQSLPVVVSIKPNIFPVAFSVAEESGGRAKAVEVSLSEQDTRVKIGERHTAGGERVALEEASVVVTGGRGVGSEEGFSTLVESLADTLSAGVGSTRAVVDAGWRPYSEQIGQTGKTVAPKLYVALGVSGAVQHLSGMNRSKVIVAINKDADAPIFKVADYGVVGDVSAVVPEFRKAVEESE